MADIKLANKIAALALSADEETLAVANALFQGVSPITRRKSAKRAKPAETVTDAVPAARRKTYRKGRKKATRARTPKATAPAALPTGVVESTGTAAS